MELLTLQEAATKLKVSTKSIQNYIKAGRLTAYRPIWKVYVSAEELEIFKTQERNGKLKKL